MQTRLLVSLSVSVSVVLGLAGSARADAIELGLRPGWTGAGSGSPVVDAEGRFLGTSASLPATSRSPLAPLTYGSGPSGELQVSWRPVPLLSVGLSTAFRLSSTPESPRLTTVHRWGWRVGPTFRAYLPTFGALAPWAALGIAYAEDRQVIRFDGTVYADTSVYGVRMQHRGVVIPLGVGIDYRWSRAFAVGPSLELARTFALSGCREYVSTATTVKTCSTDDDPVVSAKGYTTWTLAIGARLSL